MIVYRELSSLAADLGFTPRTLYAVSNRVSAHYRRVSLSKRDGGTRELSVPDPLLKSIQRAIAQKLLVLEPVSPLATAYRPGGSTRLNAALHVGKPLVLKLDILGFFDHITYPLVKEKAFPSLRYSEPNRILLTLLCTHQDALPQGAPSSPAISNIILFDFDRAIAAWCDQRGVAYSRYCDDMTFSGDFDPRQLLPVVRRELGKLGFFLNPRKTAVLRPGRRQLVTGLVVNQQLSVPREMLRSLRQELYYCRKFGLSSHLERRGIPLTPKQYAARLLGKLNYVLSIRPDDRELLQARQDLREELAKL